MKEKLIIAAKAALVAFIGALAGGAAAPDFIQGILRAIGVH